jgi:LysM repeat protein
MTSLLLGSLTSLVLKATVAIALALATAAVARRSRASLRHAIYAALFALLLLLPFAKPVMPRVDVPILVAQNNARPVVAQPAQPARVHVVERGDTLFSIARRTGTTVNALVTANGLGTPDTPLSIGRRLVIPA